MIVVIDQLRRDIAPGFPSCLVVARFFRNEPHFPLFDHFAKEFLEVGSDPFPVCRRILVPLKLVMSPKDDYTAQRDSVSR